MLASNPYFIILVEVISILVIGNLDFVAKQEGSSDMEIHCIVGK